MPAMYIKITVTVPESKTRWFQAISPHQPHLENVNFNRSADGRVARASASGVDYNCLIPSRGKPMTLK